MKTWDAILIGGGIIAFSLALELRKQGLRVLILERNEPGREASHAAAGMLAAGGSEIPPALLTVAEQSAGMYPEFVHELEYESGIKVDLRNQGTILLSSTENSPDRAEPLSPEQLQPLEPALVLPGAMPTARNQISPAYLNERSVDPRALVSAAIKAARHRDVDVSSGAEVKSVLFTGNQAVGVRTDKSEYSSGIVVNCAGAWAGSLAPYTFPVHPVKGQMLAVVRGPAIQHVVRSERVYLVPRSDGRLVIGSTQEYAGFNKQTDVGTIQKLFRHAVELAPAIAASQQHEAWAGLRPGTPDNLPILGETSKAGYFIAAGHFRDGILLAPVTAVALADLILRRPCMANLAAFSPARFADTVTKKTG